MSDRVLDVEKTSLEPRCGRTPDLAMKSIFQFDVHCNTQRQASTLLDELAAALEVVPLEPTFEEFPHPHWRYTNQSDTHGFRVRFLHDLSAEDPDDVLQELIHLARRVADSCKLHFATDHVRITFGFSGRRLVVIEGRVPAPDMERPSH